MFSQFFSTPRRSANILIERDRLLSTREVIFKTRYVVDIRYLARVLPLMTCTQRKYTDIDQFPWASLVESNLWVNTLLHRADDVYRGEKETAVNGRRVYLYRKVIRSRIKSDCFRYKFRFRRLL